MTEECRVDLDQAVGDTEMPLVPRQDAETSEEIKMEIAKEVCLDLEVGHREMPPVVLQLAETSKDTKKKMPEVGHDQTPENMPGEATRESSASSSHDQATNENHLLSSKNLKRLSRVLKTLNDREISGTGQTKFPYTKIQRVPAMLQSGENCQKYYWPRAIGIGPFHFHTKTSIRKKVKYKLAAKFIELSGVSGEYLLGEIKKNVGTLKQRFAEEVINVRDDDELAWILFLDGCSILQFLYSFYSAQLKEFNINNGQAALIQQDLLLLENQIPFFVLRLLIELSGDYEHKLRTSLKEFIVESISAIFHQYYSRGHSYREFHSKLSSAILYRFDDEDQIHLLDFLRTLLLGATDSGSGSDNDELKDKLSHQPSMISTFRRSFRNIQDLKTAGIKLRPSDTFNLRAISFSTRCFFFETGELKLPALIVDDSTVRKLWNLAAYEMCPDYHGSDNGVVSYVSFLDSLIDNEQDVKDLRSAHMLRNHLSSDAEVAKLFNTLGSCLVNTGRDGTYLNVQMGIQKHYERSVPIWMAQFYYDHFRNPWTILALLAAVTALLLTAIQTWYAIHPKK